MRSALICVFLALVVQKDGNCAENDEEFKPTPIPLIDWPRDKHDAAGTLQEIIKTDAPPTVAAVPAHYWEDALRHSVYLTLVRDKIDQLIAKGDYISADSRPDLQIAKEVDDHDLWDKIKTAKFDRLKEEPIPPADVTILARGRLFEDKDGYRFVEEDATQNNCSTRDCTKGVKAYWSVKRMKQGESSPGKYHYELTFSVTSQTPRKVKKPYENPIRTFTIKENSPTEPPHVRNYDKTIHHGERPQRAIWVHKNINPMQSYQRRPHYSRGLDRLFSSLFSDEDSYDEPIGSYKPKTRTYVPHSYPQHAKVGYIDDREPYHQKKLVPYPMTKNQAYRYSHAPIAPPPVSYVQHPYLNVDPLGNVPYVQPYSDNRFVPSNAVKTTRPAVLPTPITNYPLMKESTIEVSVKTKPNATEYTTKEPEVATNHKMYNQQKPMKISYLTDHIRPPVYNAPPGVFVTMDKKPFKPMPPLKINHGNKPHKSSLPDFRPSPQVLDTQFSELDTAADTAFRPISMNFTDISSESPYDSGKKNNNKNSRKPILDKKPTKKHENIKYNRLTTVTPDIITAQTLPIEENAMEWANLLGAFTKTTPMASHKDRSSTESSDAIISTTPSTASIAQEVTEDMEDVYEETPSSSTTTSTSTTTTTTTAKPKKRTRPPPKFNKQDKIKKHKRVTTTTTTTTTVKPTRKYYSKKPTDDLTPQASSAATSGTNSIWETNTPKAPASSTTTSTTPRPTTTVKLTTSSTSSTTSRSSTIVDTEQPVVTTQPKSKNRFRQSTLMQKGTSVNHDKWSTSTLDKNRTNTVLSNKYPRRKASKFHGYVPASTPRSPEVERNREDHRDHTFSFNQENLASSTTEQIQQAEEDILVKRPTTTTPTTTSTTIAYEEEEMNEEPSEWPLDEPEEEGETEAAQRDFSTDDQESKDDNEYIFPTASVIHEVKSSPQTAALQKESTTTQSTVVASTHSVSKNKTKCKKKKHDNLTTTEGAYKSSSSAKTSVTTEHSRSTTITTTTSSPTSVTVDILTELFGGFTMDDTTEKPVRSTSAPEQNQSQSQKHERYAHLDNDIKDFLHSLDKRNYNHTIDDNSGEEYDDENEDEEDSPFNNDEENFDSRNFNDYYEEAQESQDRPLSLLELMTME